MNAWDIALGQINRAPPKIPGSKQCGYCYNPFISDNERAQYCCPDCKYKAKLKRQRKVK